MTTTKKTGNTRKNTGTRKVSEKVTAKDLQAVVNSVPVSVPGGVGVGSAASGSVDTAPQIKVGGASVSRRAARLDLRAKLESNIKFEGFTPSLGVRELSTKLVGNFAAPEWSGSAADTVKESLNMMLASGVINQDQRDQMWRAAAKNAGVDLTAPVCSIARVLAVIRRDNLVPDLVSLVGWSFSAIRDHIKAHGLNCYSWRLGVGAVRSNSVADDFLTVTSVGPDASPSAIVGALLSLANYVDFSRRLSAARAADRSDYSTFIGLAVRLAKRLGYDVDRVLFDARQQYEYCATSDAKERKQLRKNLATAVDAINVANDTILSLGGVTVLWGDNCPAKTARTIKAALKDRSRAYSVAATCEKLLNM